MTSSSAVELRRSPLVSTSKLKVLDVRTGLKERNESCSLRVDVAELLRLRGGRLTSFMPSRRLRTRPVIAKANARSDGSVASRTCGNGGDTDGASWAVWWSWPVSCLLRSFLPAKTSRRSGRASSRWSRATDRVSRTLGESTGVANEGAGRVSIAGSNRNEVIVVGGVVST